jgi:hypothetical protein
MKLPINSDQHFFLDDQEKTSKVYVLLEICKELGTVLTLQKYFILLQVFR